MARKTATTLLAIAVYLPAMVGGVGLTIAWTGTFLKFFDDGQTLIGLLALVTTPLFTPITGWFADPVFGWIAVGGVVLMGPATYVQGRADGDW